MLKPTLTRCRETAACYHQRIRIADRIRGALRHWQCRPASLRRTAGGLAISIILTMGTALVRTQPAAARSTSIQRIHKIINRAAKREGLDPALVRAVVRVESGFDPRSYSSTGAIGLMQLMPLTARHLGVRNPWDPEQNVRGGTRFLRWLLVHFKGNERLAIAAYNAGPGAVSRYGGVPPYRETRNYVARVLAYRRRGG